MSWADQKLDFSSLIFQYNDFAGSPDNADQWATEDLEYLALLIHQELQRRSGSAEASR